MPQFCFVVTSCHPKLQNTTSKTPTINMEGTTISREGTTLSLQGTTKQFPNIPTFTCHLYFMFALNFVLLLLAPKPTTREKQPLYASQTHKVAAPTSVQSYIAAADHPSVPHGHLYNTEVLTVALSPECTKKHAYNLKFSRQRAWPRP